VTILHSLTRHFMQCLKCEWTIMDGVQALIFEAGRRPATNLVKTAWTPSTCVHAILWQSVRNLLAFEKFFARFARGNINAQHLLSYNSSRPI